MLSWAASTAGFKASNAFPVLLENDSLVAPHSGGLSDIKASRRSDSVSASGDSVASKQENHEKNGTARRPSLP